MYSSDRYAAFSLSNILSNRYLTRSVTDQVRICWATAENPVANLNATLMNQTFLALQSASPFAASYPIELAALQTMTSTIPSSSTPITSTASTISTTSVASSVFSTPAPKSSNGLSSGAIGGIVSGVVGGMALIGAVVFLLWRRRKSKITDAQSEPFFTSQHPSEHRHVAVMDSSTIHEKDGQPQIAEAPAQQSLVELDSGNQHRYY